MARIEEHTAKIEGILEQMPERITASAEAGAVEQDKQGAAGWTQRISSNSTLDAELRKILETFIDQLAQAA